RRMHLVIEVVEHAGDTPREGVLAVARGVGAHGRLDGQGVLAEAVGLGEFGQEGPGALAVHQALARVRHLSMDFFQNTHWPSCPRAGMGRSAARRSSAAASMER